MRVVSPMPEGSGAIAVHRQLAEALPGYQVMPYSPRREYWPFGLHRLVGRSAELVHTAPDYAIFSAPADVPLMLTFHNYILDADMRRYSSLMQRIHYRTSLRHFTRRALVRADMVTAVSQFTADVARRDLGYDREIRVIPNGVDPKRFHPAGRDRHRAVGSVRILFSGNPTVRKGADLLPKIAAGVTQEATVLCTGGLRGGARIPGADVVTLDRVPPAKMPELYGSVDICLLPTVREGMSLAVLEAMASGLPVVTSDCASMPELVHHGKGGFLCPVGDASAFAQALNTLVDSPELRTQMGEYNRQRVLDAFDVKATVAAYRQLFQELIDRG